jgi:hypothetical protein
MDLTENQMDKLYEMAEIHFEWFQIYSPGTKYEEVLEINHMYVLDLIDSCKECNEEMIDYIMDDMILEYKDMLNDDTRDLFE